MFSGDSKESSPIFTQFIEATWQLMSRFPSSFQFNASYLQTIHDAVRVEVSDVRAVEPARLSRAVFKRLKLPSVAASGLVAKALMSHVALLDRDNITG